MPTSTSSTPPSRRSSRTSKPVFVEQLMRHCSTRSPGAARDHIALPRELVVALVAR
jgi:hypothetical protein